MKDYKEAYFALFQAMTEASAILQTALLDTEDIRIFSSAESRPVLPFPTSVEGRDREEEPKL